MQCFYFIFLYGVLLLLHAVVAGEDCLLAAVALEPVQACYYVVAQGG